MGGRRRSPLNPQINSRCSDHVTTGEANLPPVFYMRVSLLAARAIQPFVTSPASIYSWDEDQPPHGAFKALCDPATFPPSFVLGFGTRQSPGCPCSSPYRPWFLSPPGVCICWSLGLAFLLPVRTSHYDPCGTSPVCATRIHAPISSLNTSVFNVSLKPRLWVS